MHLKNPKDFWSGVMFAAIGFAFAAIVKIYDYPMGTASRMGAGYFPFVLGNIMGVLGLIILGKALVTSGGRVEKIAWRPLLWVLGAVLLFALAIKLKLGLVAAIVVLVFVSSYGGHEFKVKEVAINSVVLAIFSVAVFVYGLKLPFPIWPELITG
jgi:Tripartite tricarboxylate transporter TctB family